MSFSAFMWMTVFQMATTIWCMRWYAKKHPVEAMEMFRKWTNYFSK